MSFASKKLKKLGIVLRKFNIRIVKDNEFLILDLSQIASGFTKTIKEWIYRILNVYENHYFVSIKGLPYCLFPEAHDHIIYEKNNGVYRKFKACKICKYFYFCPGFKEKNIAPSQITPIPNLPIDIAIEVNKTCNLKCAFCLHDNKHARPNLSFNKIKDALDEARELNIRCIRFTGGEPLLRKDIFKILRYAKSKGLYVYLNTNATLVNDSIIKELEKYVDNVLVSLCGYSNHTEHIINAGSNLLKNRLMNILKLKRSKIPHIRIGTVISKLLIDNFKKYSVLISYLGIASWELYRPMLSLSSAKEHPNYRTTRDDILKLLALMARLRKSGINVYIANATPFCISNNGSHKLMMRGAQFDDGHTRLVYDSTGIFKPSYFISKDLGNNIKKAWSHPFIKKINSGEYLHNKCKNCPHLRWCLGGSRYLAKEYFNDYFACDPLAKN
jgi:radical SAM protein with 4Fe4S-binding SPASM domain